MLSNIEIARILGEVGEYLEMQDVQFKPRAYEKVAETIRSLEEEVAGIYEQGELKALKALPGVGQSIAEHIEELITTGKLEYYEELKKKTPVDLGTLTRVEGLGPKKIKALYKKLNVKTLQDLEKAAKSGKIETLEGFGKKSADNILKGIEFVKTSGDRSLLGFVMADVRVIEERLKKLEGVISAEVVGSVRRKRDTIGDLDFLVVSKNSEHVMEFFTTMPEVARVFAKGPTKSMIHLRNGLDVDLRVIPKNSYGAALNYFTGSKAHNIALRKEAIKKGWKLNEYGLYRSAGKNEVQITGSTEKELYKKLGMEYIPPELREMTGEIEAAKNNTLPKLIDYSDLKGDLQTQTTWTDGAHSIEQMVHAAMNEGLEYIAITDHTKRLAMTNGLDAQRLAQQIKTIDTLNKKLVQQKKKFRVLSGSECDILKDGTLDLPDEILKQLDVVGVSVHSYFNLNQKEQTERVIRAMKNPHADILFHPTGRLINKRNAIELDIEEIIKTAQQTKTILEIDAAPERADLKDEYIRKCVDGGVKMSISSDAHHTSQFTFLEFGIAQARRGWAEKKDIINTRPVGKMLKMLKE